MASATPTPGPHRCRWFYPPQAGSGAQVGASVYPQVFIKMPLGVEAADRRPVNDQAQQMQAGVIDRVTPALSLRGPSGYLGECLLLGDPWRGGGSWGRAAPRTIPEGGGRLQGGAAPDGKLFALLKGH